MKGAKLRRATLDDYDALKPLLQELIGDPVGNRRTAFKRALEHDEYIPFVAQLENEVVGFADLWLLPDPGHGALLGYLTSLIVVRAKRRGGIGRALVEAVIDAAKKRGAAEIHVTTKMDNEPAQKLYKTCGFDKRHTTLELEVTPFPEDEQ